MPIQPVTTTVLIASLPTWWARLRAKAKVVWSAMTSRRDRVMIVSEDGKRIDLVDADKFDPEKVASEHKSEAAGQAAPTGESGA